MRILVVDDDPVVLALVSGRLRVGGHDVTLADSGPKGQRLLSESRYDVLITDWCMPDVDGLELTASLRAAERGHYTYVILLTATSSDGKNQALDVGADAFLSKPVDAAELTAQLRVAERLRETAGTAAKRLFELQRVNRDLERELELRRQAEAQLDRARAKEEQLAGHIQSSLLFGHPPAHVEGLDTAVVTRPSRNVDGDFYDYQRLAPGVLDIVVGDVMGKGLTAALLGAATRTHLLRARTELVAQRGDRLPPVGEIVTRAQHSLGEELIQLGSFVTLCYLRLDLERQVLEYVDAGHTKTLLRRRDGAILELAGDNLPLGILADERYVAHQVPLEPGDMLVLYSDGLTEAEGPDGELFGTDRLIGALQRHANLPSVLLAEALQAAVSEYSVEEALSDDQTCLCVRIDEAPVPAAASSYREQIFGGRFAELTRICAFVREVCREGLAAVDEVALLQLEVAVNEAAANIIEHAYAGRRDGRVQIAMSLTDDYAAEVRLYHDGAPVSDDRAAPRPFDGPSVGGMGLHMIRECVDEIRYLSEPRRHQVYLRKQMADAEKVANSAADVAPSGE